MADPGNLENIIERAIANDPESTAVINEQITNNPFGFIMILTELLQKSPKNHIYVLTLLRRLFDFANKNKLLSFQTQWMLSENITVRQALFPTIQQEIAVSSDVSVINQCAAIIASLLTVEQGEACGFFEVIASQLAEFIPSHAFYLTILDELYSSKFIELLYNVDRLKPHFAQLCDIIKRLYLSLPGQQIPTHICKTLINVLARMVHLSSDCFSDSPEIKQIINTLSQYIMGLKDFSVTSASFDLIKEIVFQYYFVGPDFIEIVFLCSQEVMNDPDPEIKMLPLMLWKDIASFEKIKLECRNTRKNAKHPAILCQIAAPHVVPLLYSQLIPTDPNDNTTVSDLDEPEVIETAYTALEAFFDIIPMPMLEFVQSRLLEMGGNPPWTHVFATMYSIAALCPKRKFDHTDESLKVQQFMCECLQFVMPGTDPSLNNPALRGVSLFTLGRVYSSYPDIISKQAQSMIAPTLGLMPLNEEENPIILAHYCVIICAICKSSEGENYSEFPGDIIEIITAKINEIISLTRVQSNPRLFRMIIKTMNSLVDLIPVRSSQSVVAILLGTLERIKESMATTEQSDSENVQLYRSILCTSIRSICFKLKTLVNFDIAIDIAQTILAVYGRDQSPESIDALTGLLQCLKERVPPELAQPLMIVVQTSFGSQNVELMKYGGLLLSYFFENISTDIAFTYAIGAFNLTQSCLDSLPDDDTWREIIPSLILAEGRIIHVLAIAKSVRPESREHLFELHLNYCQILMKYSVETKYDTPEDISYAHDLFAALSVALTSYAEAYHTSEMIEPEAERQQLGMLVNLCKQIQRIPEPTEHLYVKALIMIDEFAKSCTRANNAIINNRAVANIANNCKSIPYFGAKTKKYALEVYQTIKST